MSPIVKEKNGKILRQFRINVKFKRSYNVVRNNNDFSRRVTIDAVMNISKVAKVR